MGNKRLQTVHSLRLTFATTEKQFLQSNHGLQHEMFAEQVHTRPDARYLCTVENCPRVGETMPAGETLPDEDLPKVACELPINELLRACQLQMHVSIRRQKNIRPLLA